MGLKSGAEKTAARARMANIKIGSKAPNLEAERALMEKYRNIDWSKTPRGVNPFEPSPAYADYLKKKAEQLAKAKEIEQVKKGLLGNAEKAVTNQFGQTGWDVGVGYNGYTPMGDVYKRGGKVTHAHHLDIEERPL